MVKNTISYKGENIITIYHKGFDTDLGKRNLRKIEKIGFFNVKFEEKVVDETEIEKIKEWDWKVEGLLELGDKLNPYGESACAYMEQFVRLKKPKCLFDYKDKYLLKIDIETFKNICNFTRKYTGIDFEKNPMNLGDILIYNCHETQLRGNKLDGIIVKCINKLSTIIVKFKLKGIIVCAKIIDNIDELNGDEIQIVSDKKWDSHDIEIYSDGKLIYIDRDVSYMRTLIMNMTTTSGTSDSIYLKKLGVDLTIDANQHTTTSIIGEERESIEDMLFNSNITIKQKLSEENLDPNFIFIKPGEIQKAMDYIKIEIRKKCSEIWVFDSYFADRNGAAISFDWIRIFAFCNANFVNIVFFNRTKAEPTDSNPLTPEEFVNDVNSDKLIRAKKGETAKLGINFYQINTYIHDRFIFMKKDDQINGITIGTSLNSLNGNYYSITKLNGGSARLVFEELKALVNCTNIVSKKGL